MWTFANTTYNSPFRDSHATILESRNAGNRWTIAKNLTALEGIPSMEPQVIFNQTSGRLYVCVNQGYPNPMDNGLQESSFFELGNGPDQPWTSVWHISPWTWMYYGGYTFRPLMYCALDSAINKFYFVNK